MSRPPREDEMRIVLMSVLALVATVFLLYVVNR
jgi:hypothetical protein